MTAQPNPPFSQEDRRKLIDLLVDLQREHGFPADDPTGLVHSTAFLVQGLASSLTVALGGHTDHALSADWFATERARPVTWAITLLNVASDVLKEAVSEERDT